jgi:hypothetical protein
VERTIRTRSAIVSAAVLLMSAMVAPAYAAPGSSVAASCTPHALPGLPGGTGNGEILTISDAGLYGGAAEDATGTVHAAYWTHSDPDPSKGWQIHAVPSGLSGDDVYDINRSGLMLGGEDSDTPAGYLYDPSTQHLTWLPSLGGVAFGRRLNDAGVVAGYSTDATGQAFAVTWSPPYTAAHRLPVIGATQSLGGGREGSQVKMFSEALGIDDAGQVVGASVVGAPVPDTGMWARTRQWRGALAPLVEPISWAPTGAPHKLPTGYSQGFAWAANDAGTVVGSTDVDASITMMPAFWQDGAYHAMAAGLSDVVFGNAYGLRGSWAAGGVGLADGSARAFVWTGSGVLRTLTPLPGATDSWSHGPNEALRQVGGESDDATHQVATVWQCPTGFTTA